MGWGGLNWDPCARYIWATKQHCICASWKTACLDQTLFWIWWIIFLVWWQHLFDVQTAVILYSKAVDFRPFLVTTLLSSVAAADMFLLFCVQSTVRSPVTVKTYRGGSKEASMLEKTLPYLTGHICTSMAPSVQSHCMRSHSGANPNGSARRFTGHS